MRHGRRGTHDGDRISQIVRNSMKSPFAREAGGKIKEFITGKPILSTCLGLAAGFVVGMLLRRRN